MKDSVQFAQSFTRKGWFYVKGESRVSIFYTDSDTMSTLYIFRYISYIFFQNISSDYIRKCFEYFSDIFFSYEENIEVFPDTGHRYSFIEKGQKKSRKVSNCIADSERSEIGLVSRLCIEYSVYSILNTMMQYRDIIAIVWVNTFFEKMFEWWYHGMGSNTKYLAE